jgi:hypothetical protein
MYTCASRNLTISGRRRNKRALSLVLVKDREHDRVPIQRRVKDSQGCVLEEARCGHLPLMVSTAIKWGAAQL